MRFRLIVAITTLAALPATGIAQGLPADCSKMPAPKRPLEVSVVGTKFKPKSVKLLPAGGVSAGENQFDLYRLSLRSEDNLSPPLEADIIFIVRRGQRIDGKVFRRLSAKETVKQPAAFKGLPEVQGWSVRNRASRVELNQTEHPGSLRLEFGKQEGSVIVGNLHFCVPRGQAAAAGKTHAKQDSYAIGTFQARIEPN